jgi:mRNA interferase RelE/StbE
VASETQRAGEVALSDYRIFETDEFKKSNKALAPKRGRSRDKKLGEYVYPQLRQEPHYGPSIKRLQGHEPLTGRNRIGDFRIFSLIDEEEKIVFILTIDDRKDAYR